MSKQKIQNIHKQNPVLTKSALENAIRLCSEKDERMQMTPTIFKYPGIGPDGTTLVINITTMEKYYENNPTK